MQIDKYPSLYSSTLIAGKTSNAMSNFTPAHTYGVRGKVLHFLSDPEKTDPPENSYQYFEDGLLMIRDGLVVEAKQYCEQDEHTLDHIIDHQGKLIVPGFIDTHIHYPQTEMMASYGEQLLEWLNKYTFPTENKFSDYDYAEHIADIFLFELLKNGTTTALVFATVHASSVDALFTCAQARNMRLITGKVMMDRNAPDYLTDDAKTSYEETIALIKKWHKKDRLLYAITPRFAPTSSPEQLALAGKIKQDFPDVYVHTHLSENKNEIAWVKSLFPDQNGYFDVYDHFGLTGNRSVFAHCIHLTEQEWKGMASTDSTIAFCPSSNLFLGSGLFNLKKAHELNVRVGLGTDVGAGTSFSQLQTLSEAYKVSQLNGHKLSALQGLYMTTLGGAKALSLEHVIGNFAHGKEADFIVIDTQASALQALRQESSNNIADALFALMMMGDDRNIVATYIAGKRQYSNGTIT